MRLAFLDEHGICTQVLMCEPGWEELFPGATAVESDSAAVGDVFDGRQWTRPVVPPTVAELLNYAADARWRAETSGISVAGMGIATDRESRALVESANALAQADAARTFRFKATTGWVVLTAAEIGTIASAVGEHVQSCFALEADLAAAISSGDVSSYEEIDAAAWPGSA